jgi:hypothetical protein
MRKGTGNDSRDDDPAMKDYAVGEWPLKMKPPLTVEQEQVLNAFEFAIEQETLYLDNGFATEQWQRELKARTASAYQRCLAVGIWGATHDPKN